MRRLWRTTIGKTAGKGKGQNGKKRKRDEQWRIMRKMIRKEKLGQCKSSQGVTWRRQRRKTVGKKN